MESVSGYRPFGEVLEGDGGSGYGYSGEWAQADLGLVFLRARWYQPRTGRFLNPDPIIPDFENPQSINVYVYAWGDPVSSIDPSGESPLCRDECATPLGYDPRKPGPYDQRIKQSSVILEVGTNKGLLPEIAMGTVVGEETLPGSKGAVDYFLIYTHGHWEDYSEKWRDKYTIIEIWDHAHKNKAQVMRHLIKLDIRGKDLYALKVPKDSLKNLNVIPVARNDNPTVNAGDKVDVAWLSPPGDGGNKVEVWHTEASILTEERAGSGYVYSRGAPTPFFFTIFFKDNQGRTLPPPFPGGEADSGGGVFLAGKHVANNTTWGWDPQPGCFWQETFWKSKLNAGP